MHVSPSMSRVKWKLLLETGTPAHTMAAVVVAGYPPSTSQLSGDGNPSATSTVFCGPDSVKTLPSIVRTGKLDGGSEIIKL